MKATNLAVQVATSPKRSKAWKIAAIEPSAASDSNAACRGRMLYKLTRAMRNFLAAFRRLSAVSGGNAGADGDGIALVSYALSYRQTDAYPVAIA